MVTIDAKIFLCMTHFAQHTTGICWYTVMRSLIYVKALQVREIVSLSLSASPVLTGTLSSTLNCTVNCKHRVAMVTMETCHFMESNLQPLGSQVIALPTELLPVTSRWFFSLYSWRWIKVSIIKSIFKYLIKLG